MSAADGDTPRKPNWGEKTPKKSQDARVHIPRVRGSSLLALFAVPACFFLAATRPQKKTKTHKRRPLYPSPAVSSPAGALLDPGASGPGLATGHHPGTCEQDRQQRLRLFSASRRVPRCVVGASFRLAQGRRACLSLFPQPSRAGDWEDGEAARDSRPCIGRLRLTVSFSLERLPRCSPLTLTRCLETAGKSSRSSRRRLSSSLDAERRDVSAFWSSRKVLLSLSRVDARAATHLEPHRLTSLSSGPDSRPLSRRALSPQLSPPSPRSPTQLAARAADAVAEA